MTVTATAKRRRKQMANGMKHLSPKRRPRYFKGAAAPIKGKKKS